MSAFDTIWNATAERIDTDAEEVELIAAAKTGDEAALLRIFSSYLPLMCQAVAKYTRVLPLDDARQAAFLGLLSAVRSFDPVRSKRLASVIRQHLQAELSEAAQEAGAGFSVPSRTLERFLGILDRADGDVNEAAKLAPSFEMKADTFFAILEAVNAGNSLEAAVEARGDDSFGEVTQPREIADAEHRVLTDLAFRAVNSTEGDVCRLAYGFADYDPQPDAEIGHRLGFSRLKALRTRQVALTKMRSALGALNV